MSTQLKSSAKILTRRIQVLDAWLRGELPRNGWTIEDIMRIAFHRVYIEDVEQRSGLKPVTDPRMKAAMQRWRAKHELDEPDYPKSARERHEKSKILPDFLRRTPKAPAPEQQENIDAFKHDLTEIVDANLYAECDDTSLELSDEESTAISNEVDEYIETLLQKKVDDLDSEDAKDRIREHVAEYVRERIQKRIDNRTEGA
jgi:hypothetical protein